MAAIGLDHYNIRAPSPLLEELRDFYVSTVGLRVGPRPPFRSFACEDFTAMCAALTAAGIEYEIDEAPATHRLQVFFRDPAGNGVELNFRK